jgi:RNA polymerase sigma factor (sigma-70 family)
VEQSQWIEFLINRHSQPLIRYVTSILKDKEAAKEIVQECFLTLLEQKQEEVRDYVQAWMYRECRNRAIDLWRKRRKLEPLGDKDEEILSFADTDPFRDLELQQDVARLRAEIGKLPSRHQEALWLKYKDGLSYKQIAEVLGISASNVGFILFEAVKALRESAVTSGREPLSLTKRKYSE